MGSFSSLHRRIVLGFVLFCCVAFFSPYIHAASASIPLEDPTAATKKILDRNSSGISDTIKDVSGQLRSKTTPIALYIEELTTLPTQIDVFLTHPTNNTLKSKGLSLLSLTVFLLLSFYFIEFTLTVRLSRFFTQKKIHAKLSIFLISTLLGPLLFFGLSIGFFGFLNIFELVWPFLYKFSAGFLILRIFLQMLLFALKEWKEFHPRLCHVVVLSNPLFLGCYLIIFSQSYLQLLSINDLLASLISLLLTVILLALLLNLFFIFYISFEDTSLLQDQRSFRPQLFKLTSKKLWSILAITLGIAYLTWNTTWLSNILYIKILSSGLILLSTLAIVLVVRYLFRLLVAPHSPLFKMIPQVATQLSKSISHLRLIISVLLTLISLILVAHIWEIHLIEWVNQTFHVNIINVALDVAILIFLGIMTTDCIEISFIHYIKYLAARRQHLAENDHHYINWLNTLLPLFQKAIRVLLSIVFFLIIMNQINVDITPFLAGLSLLGLAISFGSQTYIKNLIASLNILFSGSINLGDLVEIGKFKGKVESLSLRAVELRDLDTGAIHIIPFGDVGEISNYTREYNFCSFELNIPPSVNLEKLSQIFQEVLDALNEEPDYKGMILGPPQMWGLKSLDSLGICIQCRFKISPYCALRIKPAFLERLNRALINHKIPLSAPIESFLAYLSDPSPAAR